MEDGEIREFRERDRAGRLAGAVPWLDAPVVSRRDRRPAKPVRQAGAAVRIRSSPAPGGTGSRRATFMPWRGSSRRRGWSSSGLGPALGSNGSGRAGRPRDTRARCWQSSKGTTRPRPSSPWPRPRSSRATPSVCSRNKSSRLSVSNSTGSRRRSSNPPGRVFGSKQRWSADRDPLQAARRQQEPVAQGPFRDQIRVLPGGDPEPQRGAGGQVVRDRPDSSFPSSGSSRTRSSATRGPDIDLLDRQIDLARSEPVPDRSEGTDQGPGPRGPRPCG